MGTHAPPDDSLDDEACWISAARAAGGHDPNDGPALLLIDRLRRLETSERQDGGSRQMLQKIISARRLLGDTADFGPYAGSFTPH